MTTTIEEVMKTVGQASKELYGINPFEKKEGSINDYETHAEKLAFIQGEISGMRQARRLLFKDKEAELASYAPTHG